MNLHDETKSKLGAFALDQITWAELEGMTFDEARAIAQVGCELAMSGRLEESKVLFEGLVAGNPKDAAARAALGTVYQKLHRHDEALAEYSAAIEVDPNNPIALGNRGELLLKRGDPNGYADLAKAVEVDPLGQTAAGRRAQGLVKAITLMAVKAGGAR